MKQAERFNVGQFIGVMIFLILMMWGDWKIQLVISTLAIPGIWWSSNSIIEFIIVFIILMLLIPTWLRDFFVAIFGGWIEWLYNLPKLVLHHPELTLALLAGVLILTIGSHVVIKNLFLNVQQQWKLRWTLITIGMALLIGTTSIGITGLIHETIWLSNTFSNANFIKEFYHQRHLQSRIENGLEIMNTVAIEITATYRRTGQKPIPRNIENWSIEYDDLFQDFFKSLMITDNGSVVLTYFPEFFKTPFNRRNIGQFQEKSQLILKPEFLSNKTVEWKCYAQFSSKFGSTEFLPPNCIQLSNMQNHN